MGSGIGEGFGIVPGTALQYGVDFNPAVDSVRVVSDADLNLRVNPDTGAAIDDDAAPGVQSDVALAYAPGDAAAGANPSVVAVAYTGNRGGSANTTNTAYAAMRVRNRPGLGLYTIDLATGAATLVGRIGTSNIPLVGMTVVQ